MHVEIFCPYHVSLSDIKLPALVAWGIGEVEKGDPIIVHACDDHNHDNHIYLAPFHLTNPELLTCYEEIMITLRRKLLKRTFRL